MPKGLPDYSFDAIALCRKTRVAFAYRQTQARRGSFSGSHQYRKVFIPAALRPFENPLERRTVAESPRLVEAPRAASFRLGEWAYCRLQPARYPGTLQLRRKLGPTLGTSAFEYQAACFSGHAGTKTVSALALELTGLERAFHLLVPS